MANNEGVIQALHEFENMTDADKVLTQELEDLFVQIAHTGRTQIPWVYLKPVFMFKMDKVMRDFFESSPSRNSNSTEPTNNAEFDVMRQRLLDCIESFTSAPFTMQRLCELMVEPKRHYRCSEKFMRGIEKNVLVVSTMTENGEEELSNNIEGNHDNTSIPNGPVTNGIITTASPTEMQSVDSRDSDGELLQHFPETHYPTDEELQKCNESHTIENKHLEEEQEEEQEEEKEDEEEETKTEAKEEECAPNEKESTQNSNDKMNDSSENKESETEKQEHNEKDNKVEDKTLEEKNELKEVSEEKEKCDAEKEDNNENIVGEEKIIDNCDESKKETLPVADSKETESQKEASTTPSAVQDEPMEE